VTENRGESLALQRGEDVKRSVNDIDGRISIDDPDIVQGLMRSVSFVTQACGTLLIPDGSYKAIGEH
jgi:hypothetical protein